MAAYSSYLRDRAEQALRLAGDSTDQALAKRFLDDAAEYMGRAAAIEILESLREAATEFSENRD